MNPSAFDAFYGMHAFTCASCQKPKEMPILVYLRWYHFLTDGETALNCADCVLDVKDNSMLYDSTKV